MRVTAFTAVHGVQDSLFTVCLQDGGVERLLVLWICSYHGSPHGCCPQAGDGVILQGDEGGSIAREGLVIECHLRAEVVEDRLVLVLVAGLELSAKKARLHGWAEGL